MYSEYQYRLLLMLLLRKVKWGQYLLNDIKDVVFLILLVAITNFLRGGKIKNDLLALSFYLREVSP